MLAFEEIDLDGSDYLLGLKGRLSHKLLLALLKVSGEILSIKQVVALHALDACRVVEHPFVLFKSSNLGLKVLRLRLQGQYLLGHGRVGLQ